MTYRKSGKQKSVKNGGCNAYTPAGLCGCMLGGKRRSRKNKKRSRKTRKTRKNKTRSKK